jgi:hypothetical protein
MKANVGQFGGVVVVGFQAGPRFLRPGFSITPAIAQAIPIENRCGLERAGNVTWHTAPPVPPAQPEKKVLKNGR